MAAARQGHHASHRRAGSVTTQNQPSQHVRIHGDGIIHIVEIAGHRVEAMATGLTLEIDARTRTPVLTLRLHVRRGLDVETMARARVDAETEEALKAMGWTPPDADALPDHG